MQSYERFIQDVANYIIENLNAVSNMYYNIYFDGGTYWIKLEATDYHPLLARPMATERVLDAVASFTVAEIHLEIMDAENRMEQQELLKKFLRTEISTEAFEIWTEFN